VKNKSLVLAVAAIFFNTLFFLSCKKVNEATDLGGDLIPSVDNVNTFEVSLPAETDNVSLLNDTTRFLFGDVAALGYMNDPEFGTTKADIHFSISSKTYTSYPFIKKDQLIIDSVVLSLGYVGGYGDTANSTQTVNVYEIDPSVSVHDSVFRYTDNELPLAGASLGTKTFALNSLKDTITLIRKKDTTKVVNVVRIRLDNSLGTKLASFDTIKGANGAYYSDSIFQTLFKGLAVKTSTTGNALSYYDLFNDAKTNLTVYFRATNNNNGIDTSSATFYHAPLYESGTLRAYGIANTVKRTPANNWQTYLANGNPLDDKLYIQSAPGSYAGIRIPGLDNLSNRTIHLAELIIYKIPSVQDNIFTPSRLYLDKINNAKDSAFIFERDQSVNTQGQVSYNGGNLKSDNTYRFNITRHVQGIVTRQEPNQILRLYAPLWSNLNVKNTDNKVVVPVIDKIASGRAVLAGGNYSDPNMRLKLRIVYSNL
jgi:hypothetical protein